MLIKGSYEDIIYIVIGVLWIGYSIYKGTQKSKARSVKRNTLKQAKKEEKKSVFETFFDDILTEEKPTTFIPYEDNNIADESEGRADISEKTDKDVVEDIGQEKVFSYDDYYEEGNFQEDTDVIDSGSNVTELKDKQIKITTFKYKKKPRFDLRKAVVYSEILNRRYF